ncbi:MAG: hypothetical protein GY950_02310 [bacterium]|nr:hypothetical protein [bacterium]
MKSKLILAIFLICIVLVPFKVFSEESEEEPGAFVFDFSMINRMPGGYFYPFVIENYAPDATFLTEANNGFAMIDNPRVYFEGDSFTQFNWHYNGLNINSSLNDGSPAVLLPFSSVTAYRLQGENPLSDYYGMNFISQLPRRNYSRLTASSVYGDMGGMWLKFMIQPSHPTERADRLYNERRQLASNYFIDYQWGRQFNKNSHLMIALNYFDIKRQFNDFNVFDETFEESGKLVLGHARFQKKSANGIFELFGVFNYKERSNQGAETAAYPQETTAVDRYAYMAGMVLKKKNWDLKVSVTHESEDITPTAANFSKDLVDTDGDGFLPFDKLGQFSATTVNAQFNMALMSSGKVKLNLFAHGRYSSLSGAETVHDYNPLLVGGQPYLVLSRWFTSGYEYKNVNADAEAGLRMEVDISKDVSLLAKLWGKYNYLDFDNGDNNLRLLAPGFDLGIRLFKSKKTGLLFSYGRIPYDIRENVNGFLENRRPGGVFLQWEDSNNDLAFQAGEQRELLRYTGGAYHVLDESAAAPMKERLLLLFSTPLSRRFVLDIKGIYKRIKNNFRVAYASGEDYGFFEQHNGYDLFFLDRPVDMYSLTNNYLEKDPFYAAFHFTIKGERKNKWHFSFTFMAHMGMGDTAFGNGPGSNDIGILSESQADPNSWINGFGRVDGDRGFVMKSYFGFYLGKRLFMGISLKYRDGNPFAFINSLSRHDQWVLYYSTIKAENEKGVKGGPREDYLADVSVRLNYSFKLFNKDAVLSLSVFNLLDFGGELSEYVFSGGTRDALELQVPRSLRLTLNWRF